MWLTDRHANVFFLEATNVYHVNEQFKQFHLLPQTVAEFYQYFRDHRATERLYYFESGANVDLDEVG